MDPLPFSRLRRRKDSNGVANGAAAATDGGNKAAEKERGGGGEKQQSQPATRDFDEYAKKNKLDPTMTDDLVNDIISHNPGVSWKDIAGELGMAEKNSNYLRDILDIFFFPSMVQNGGSKIRT